jgi:aspartate/methionine/tyrosine aminotransferase
MITVNTIDSTNFEVIVEGHTTTTHRVTLTHLYYQKLTNNQVTPEMLVEKSFEFLVKTAGVLLLPGSVYDDSGNHFRIGFVRQNLPEAIGRLEDFLLRL